MNNFQSPESSEVPLWVVCGGNSLNSQFSLSPLYNLKITVNMTLLTSGDAELLRVSAVVLVAR